MWIMSIVCFLKGILRNIEHNFMLLNQLLIILTANRVFICIYF